MKQRAAQALRVGAIPLGWRATLFLPVALCAISCERLPTAADKVAPPRPNFAVVPGSGSWTTKAPMSTGRSSLSVGVVNDILYAVGGAGNFTELSVNEAYDPATNIWSSKAPAPTGVDESAAGVVNGVLYVVGGSTGYGCQGAFVAINRAYDPATDTWTTKTPMPTARCGAAGAAVGGLLYVVGGNGSATVEAYDPATDTWTTKAPMSTGRGALGNGAAAVNGILYVLGGDNGGRLSTVEAYDPATNTWTTKAPMSTARAYVGAAVVNGILYAVGGANATSVVNTVEAYDPPTDTWTTVASMPTPRCCVGVGVVNGVVFAVGGDGGNSTRLTTNEAFTPLQTPARLTLTPLTAVNPVGTQHCVTATVEDASGNPVPAVTVRFSVGPSVPTTFPSPSSGTGTTDANGQAMFCYTAALPGADRIHAFADASNDGTQGLTEPSGDAAKTWTPPASTHLCQVTITDGGWIIANNTDRANFGGNAKVLANGTPQGQQNYQDQGPVQAMNVHSTEITATTCSQDRPSASIFGRATIDGAGPHVFRIDVTDAGAGGSNDTYGIMLETGYASGQHQLGGGNVTIH